MRVVALEHARDGDELWWMTTPGAFLQTVFGQDERPIARIVTLMPTAIAALASRGSWWPSKTGETRVLDDASAPTTDDVLALTRVLWRPYLGEPPMTNTPLQHPEDALIVAHAIVGYDDAHVHAVGLRDHWPGTGLRLAEVLADQPGRLPHLIAASEMCENAGLVLRMRSTAGLVVIADAVAANPSLAGPLAEVCNLFAASGCDEHLTAAAMIVALAEVISDVPTADQVALLRLSLELSSPDRSDSQVVAVARSVITISTRPSVNLV